MKTFLLIALMTTCVFAQAADKRFRYSYYLFETPRDHKGCSDCYIPLLISKLPLETNTSQEVFLMVTYERDSIWDLQDDLTTIKKSQVDVSQKKIKIENKTYRYQLISNEET